VLSVPGSVRIFLCLMPADMRRSFDALAGQVEAFVGEDPRSGDLFIFRSRRGDRLKMLYWDRDGYALWYKRLEAGTFAWPACEGASVRVTAAQLAMLLEGVEFERVRRRVRFGNPHAKAPEAPG
jgi:transposase